MGSAPARLNSHQKRQNHMPRHEAGSRYGYNNKHSTKTSTRASGVVVTKGKGHAMVSANQNGIKSAAAAEEGSYMENNFGKKEDSWVDASGYQKDSRGNSVHFGHKGAKKQQTMAKSKAAAKGRGAIFTDISEDGVNVAARGEKGTMANSTFGQQEDSWSNSYARKKNQDGSHVHSNDKRGTKRRSRSQSNAMGLGAGAAVVHSGKRGTKAKVHGKHGAKVQSKHDIQDDSWADTNLHYRNKDGSHGGAKNKWAKKQDSQASVDSEAYGNANIQAETDVSEGVNLKAKGDHGTRSQFGWGGNSDGWGEQKVWGVGARALEENDNDNDNEELLERIEKLEDAVIDLQKENDEFRRILQKHE
jgi:hypothetical protein